jgi:voltage-gated potassium channel
VTITAGYGNVEPVTKFGEIIALVSGFLGVCMAAIMTGIVASAFSNQVARKKAAFEAQLREVFKDGQMSEDEQAALKRLQVQYRFTDLQVEAMLQRAKSKTAGGRS